MNRLYELRHEKNLNQEQLAKAIGFSQQLISRYESEKSKLINPKLEESICDFFGCSLDYLRGRSSVRNEKIHTATLQKLETVLQDFYANRYPQNGKEWTQEDWDIFRDWLLANQQFFQHFYKK